MKRSIVILSGGAGPPMPDFGDRTALAVASMPVAAELSTRGRVGAVVPRRGGDEVANRGESVAGLFGVVRENAPGTIGDGCLRAAAAGVNLEPSEAALALDLIVTGGEPADTPGRYEADGGVVLDTAPQGVTPAEAKALIVSLAEAWRAEHPAVTDTLTAVPGETRQGVQGHFVIDRGGPFAHGAVHSVAADRLIGERWQDWPPEGEAGALLAAMMETGRAVLAEHPVSISRREAGLVPVSMAWLSTARRNTAGSIDSFHERYGLRACLVGGTPEVIGLAALAGIDRLPLPVSETNAEPELGIVGAYAVDALDRYDVVIVFCGSPSQAALAGEPHTVMDQLESIDAAVIGPLRDALARAGDPERDRAAEGWRLAVLIDRVVNPAARRPEIGATPFLLAGSWVRSVVQHPFDERAVAESDLLVEQADDLMEYLLFSGVAGARPNPPKGQRRRPGATDRFL